MPAYYNEIDPYAAQWLRNLISAGHIAPGEVDGRSIVDVRPSDLAGFDQCHFFAGIGVWSHALRRAGWPDDRPVWTGSCPCQPFSAAGQGGGFDDERHLWPAFFHLIEQCRPGVVFGEQVASKDGLAWLDLVQADLEGAGYAVGAVDTCAAGFGAPHIRQRLYWVADADSGERQRLPDGEGRIAHGTPPGWLESNGVAQSSGELRVMADTDDARLEIGSIANVRRGIVRVQRPSAAARELSGIVADADGRDTGAKGLQRGWQHGQQPQDTGAGQWIERPGPTNGLWRDADWLLCRDNKWRPVEPKSFPLAHSAPSRVGRLRAYGNAIVATQAEEFIGAYLTAGSGVINHDRIS